MVTDPTREPAPDALAERGNGPMPCGHPTTATQTNNGTTHCTTCEASTPHLIFDQPEDPTPPQAPMPVPCSGTRNIRYWLDIEDTEEYLDITSSIETLLHRSKALQAALNGLVRHLSEHPSEWRPKKYEQLMHAATEALTDKAQEDKQ
jgi:hypothetical protein